MITTISEGIIRVVILSVNGLYTQIYDELYCTKEKYNEILLAFGNSVNYKVIKI